MRPRGPGPSWRGNRVLGRPLLRPASRTRGPVPGPAAMPRPARPARVGSVHQSSPSLLPPPPPSPPPLPLDLPPRPLSSATAPDWLTAAQSRDRACSPRFRRTHRKLSPLDLRLRSALAGGALSCGLGPGSGPAAVCAAGQGTQRPRCLGASRRRMPEIRVTPLGEWGALGGRRGMALGLRPGRSCVVSPLFLTATQARSPAAGSGRRRRHARGRGFSRLPPSRPASASSPLLPSPSSGLVSGSPAASRPPSLAVPPQLNPRFPWSLQRFEKKIALPLGNNTHVQL